MTLRIRAARLPSLAVLTLMAVSIALVLLAAAPAVQGYVGQNPYDVRMSGPSGTVPCTQNVTITATVKSATSEQPVPLQAVNWDIKSGQSSADRLSDNATRTDSKGTTSVTLIFGPAAGARVVRATIATYPATIKVTCSGPVNPSPTPQPTPRRTPQPTPRSTAHPTPAPTNQPAGSTPAPRPSALPGTFTSTPALPDTGPDLSLLLMMLLSVSAAALLLRRLSRA